MSPRTGQVIRLDIPRFGALRLEHLVLDYNGTLAADGRLLPGVRTRLRRLARSLNVHVLTADTFGKARSQLRHLPVELVILGAGRHDRAKLSYLRRLGAGRTVAIGNGRNDRLMLRAAALSIAVVEGEGAAASSVLAATIVTRSARDALALLLKPRRLVATLRA